MRGGDTLPVPRAFLSGLPGPESGLGGRWGGVASLCGGIGLRRWRGTGRGLCTGLSFSRVAFLGRGTGSFSVGEDEESAVEGSSTLLRRFSALMLRMCSRDGLFLTRLALRNATWVLSLACVLSSISRGLMVSNASIETA